MLMPQEAAQVSDKHREKEASRDDDPNLLTAWYSLEVGYPVEELRG